MPRGIYPRRKSSERKPPKLISHPEAMAFQQEHRRRNGVVTWTVIKRDGCFMAEPSVGGRTYRCRLQASELERLRKLLPPGLTHFPGDETVQEVWI